MPLPRPDKTPPDIKIYLVSKEFLFNSPGSKLEIGIDFSSAGSRLSSIDTTEIRNFTISVQGSQVSDSYPTLSIDIGNDNIKDYKYQGNTLLGYEPTNRSYLSDNTPDGSVFIRGSDVFCENVILNSSKNIAYFFIFLTFFLDLFI